MPDMVERKESQPSRESLRFSPNEIAIGRKISQDEVAYWKPKVNHLVREEDCRDAEARMMLEARLGSQIGVLEFVLGTDSSMRFEFFADEMLQKSNPENDCQFKVRPVSEIKQATKILREQFENEAAGELLPEDYQRHLARVSMDTDYNTTLHMKLAEGGLKAFDFVLGAENEIDQALKNSKKV